MNQATPITLTKPKYSRTGRVWILGGTAVALIVAAPLLAIVWIALFPSENIWPHLATTILPRHSWNTVLLMLGNGIGVFVIGTSTAWLVATSEFPGRRLFEWALAAAARSACLYCRLRLHRHSRICRTHPGPVARHFRVAN